MKVKTGVKIQGLKQTMVKPLCFLDTIYKMIGVELVVTDAIRKGDGSLHNSGHAVDVRTRDLTHIQKACVLSLLIMHLGNDYDVIAYDTHFHIEYQRQLDDNKAANFIAAFGREKFDSVD